MAHDGEGNDIEGAHGPVALWRTVGIPLLAMVAILVAFVLVGVDWHVLLFLGVIFGAPTLVRPWDRTVVSTAGVRLRRWFRWRTLSWSQIARVAEPGRWKAMDVVAIITTEGQGVPLDLPGSRRAEFIRYAEAHGISENGPRPEN
ncbi:PH domain-containing protein [Terrabacter sp. 2YAF2]|uniref:PH domain-containing protein n=1 Tax=Terrabacter sp. 2YAF2 TaxID=3233026 RepID=UPI003F963314